MFASPLAQSRFSAAQNGIDMSLDVVLCNFSKSLDGQFVTVPINSKILAVYESELLKFGNECQMLWCIGRRLMQAADPIHAARFLRVAGQRPCHCRTTKKTDERPPSHLRPYVEAIIAARSSSVEGVGVRIAERQIDVRLGSASLRRAARLRRVSAMPSIATESVRRDEPTR